MRRLLLVVPLLLLSAAPAHATSTLHFRCGGGTVNGVAAIESMENEYIIQAYPGSGGCWFHIGHHTYDIGREVALHRLHGSLFSVEQHFTPPIELAGTDFSVLIETSRNGRSWSEASRLVYPIMSGTRQSVVFDIDTGGAVARYVRIRQPLSAAQGLSGYLDSSNFDGVVSEVAQPAPAAADLTLTCAGGIMEAIYPGHPCWFGGINRYDSPSVFHTYPVRVSDLTSIAGSVTILPWRSDDFNSGGRPGDARTTIRSVVQTSTDGVRWATLGTLVGTYGVPTPFSFTQPSTSVAYIRLVADYHSQARTHPALKHVRGFIVDSSLTLTTAALTMG